MDHLKEFFLENQRDLDRENAPESPPPPPECKHRWERVLINHEIPGYSCSRCGAEKYARRFDDQDFEGRTYNSHCNRKPKPAPGPRAASRPSAAISARIPPYRVVISARDIRSFSLRHAAGVESRSPVARLCTISARRLYTFQNLSLSGRA